MPPALRPPARLGPSMLVAVLGGLLVWFNVSAAMSQARLLVDGRSVRFTIEQCAKTGPNRACVGSYRLDGKLYRDRILLGHDQALPGDVVSARVDRRHPGDPSAPGVGGLVEAGLLASAGTVLAAVGAVRAARACRRRGPSPGRSAPRSWRERARVWAPPEASAQTATLEEPPPAQDGSLP